MSKVSEIDTFGKHFSNGHQVALNLANTLEYSVNMQQPFRRIEAPDCHLRRSDTLTSTFSSLVCSSSAARHRPRHPTGPFHDGDAAWNGLQRPAAQPAAAEEARLQPAAHRQRAGADGRGQPEPSRQRSTLRDGGNNAEAVKESREGNYMTLKCKESI